MKPILVHCHIFYPELWPELKKHLLNICPYEFDLFVTMVENHSEIASDILETFSKPHIEIVENKGYDVAPFIHVLQSVHLDDYSLVVKIHTKRDMPIGSLIGTIDVGGNRWRKYALSFLKTSKTFDKCVKAFEHKQALGMVSNARLILTKDTNPLSASRATSLMKRFKIAKAFRNTFVAGTMFVVRASIMKPLQDFDVNISDDPDDTHQEMGMTHAMERLFGAMVWAQGYEIDDVFSVFPMTGWFWDCLRKISMFLFREKVDKDGRYTIRIFRIPVFRRTIKK